MVTCSHCGDSQQLASARRCANCGASLDGGQSGPSSADPLYPAAYRLARFGALISPGTLMDELSIDRERAERLLAELEAHGVVGPIIFVRSGARESRVNMVTDPVSGLPTEQDDAVAPTPRAGTRALWAMLLGVGVALALTLTSMVIDWGRQLVVALLPASNEALGVVGGTALAIASGGLGGLLVERVFWPGADIVPAWTSLARQALWLCFAFVTIGIGIARMFA